MTATMTTMTETVTSASLNLILQGVKEEGEEGEAGE